MSLMRVLVLVDDCNPDWPSLPSLGQQMVKALAQRVELRVATHVRHRPTLEPALEGIDVTFIDNEYVARPLFALAKWLRRDTQANWSAALAMAYPAAVAFDYEVLKAFRGPLESGQFDLVHRLTSMSPALPSPLATWSPVPFVLGPLNGALERPGQSRAERLQLLRKLYQWLPYHRATYRDSAAILASFPHRLSELPPSAISRVIDFPEVGVAPELSWSAQAEKIVESYEWVLGRRGQKPRFGEPVPLSVNGRGMAGSGTLRVSGSPVNEGACFASSG